MPSIRSMFRRLIESMEERSARNAQRRKDALEDLEGLSRVAQELSHLLLVRELRGTVERTG